MSKKFKTSNEAAKEIKGSGMAKTILFTDPKLTKKSRKTGEALPEKFSGLQKVTYGSFPIGYTYFDETKGVGKQLTASGSSPDKFTVEKASGMHQESENGIVYASDKNPEQKYIRFYYQTGKLHSKSETLYINEKGEVIVPTDEEYAEYFPPKSLPKKQMDAGMDEDKVVLPFSPKAENVKYLKFGEIEYGNEDKVLNKIIDMITD